MNSWSVYILLCSDGSLYTGCTTDVMRRFGQHSRGKGAKYTRSRLPVKLMYTAEGLTHSVALKEEYRIKKLKRSEKVWLADNWHATHKEGNFCLTPKS